jgi:methylase of polypeptide subunit release factors
VEINTELAEETAAVFSQAGFSSVEIIRDLFDRPRFVSFGR